MMTNCVGEKIQFEGDEKGTIDSSMSALELSDTSPIIKVVGYLNASMGAAAERAPGPISCAVASWPLI